MTITEFAILVKEMRDCQKKYFRSRLRDALNRSKELEKEVDQAIKEDKLLAEKSLLEKEVDWFADKLSQASGSMFDDELGKLGFQCSHKCESAVCTLECCKKNWREAARKAVE